MASIEITARPPSSLLLVGDPRGEIPELMASLVQATSGLLAIGTLSDIDGETHVRISDSHELVSGRPNWLAFDGAIAVSSPAISIANIAGESYADWPVDPGSVRLQVWVNDPSEPDEIWIVTG